MNFPIVPPSISTPDSVSRGIAASTAEAENSIAMKNSLSFIDCFPYLIQLL